MLQPHLNSVLFFPFLLALAGAAGASAQATDQQVRDRDKVALLPLTCERGVEPEICKVLGDSIALAIADAPGLEPITPGDLQVMMGAQALSELSSCGGEACFVGDEALRIDAAWLLGGTVTSLGENTRTVMRLVDLSRGAVIDRGEVTVPATDEEALDQAVRRLTLRILARRGLLTVDDNAERLQSVREQPEETPLAIYAGAGLAGVGVLGLATAGVLGGLAFLDVQNAKTAAALGEAGGVAARAEDARLKAYGADLLLVTGGALVVTGLVIALVGAL